MTTLGISGTQFTINGVPTFLLGVNYYNNGVGWFTSDLDALVARGYNLVRIWATGHVWSGYTGAIGTSSLTAGGLWVSDAVRDDFIAFVDACDSRGIICDVVCQSNSAPITDTQAARTQAITTVATTLANKTNCFFDLCNEHQQGTTDAEISAWNLKGVFLAAAPNRIWHISVSADHVISPSTMTVNSTQRTNLTFHANTLLEPLLADHKLEDTSLAWWSTQKTAHYNALRAELALLGKNIPIIDDEPQWERTARSAGLTMPAATTLGQWMSSARVAKDAGFAGYVLDAEAGVFFGATSYVANLTANASLVFDTMPSLLASTLRARGWGPIWGQGDTDTVDTALTTHTPHSTWTMLVYRGAPGTNDMRIWAKENTVVAEAFYFDLSEGEYRFHRDWTTADGRWSIPAPAQDAWVQVTVTYDSGAAANKPLIYLNGVAQTVTDVLTPSGSAVSNADAYMLGRQRGTTVSTWRGKLGRFAKWNRILSSVEVASLTPSPNVFASPATIPSGLVEFVELGTTDAGLVDVPVITGTTIQALPGDAAVPLAVLTFPDTGLTPGTSYTYRARAEDNDGNISDYSAPKVLVTAPVGVDTEPPTDPGPPSLVSRTSTALTVSWPESTDNVGVAEYGVAAGVEPDVVVAAPPATIADLTPFTTYPVSVVARDAVPLESGTSPTVEFTTLRLARLVSGGQVLRAPTLPAISDYPLTVGLAIYPTVNDTGFCWSLANHLSETDFLAIKAQLMGGVIHAHATRANATGFAAGASSVLPLALNTWQRVIAVFASATSCSIRLQGDTAAVDAGLLAFPAGLSRLTVGGLDRLTPVQPFTGGVADLAIWDAALDEVEQAAWLAGTAAWFIRRANLLTHSLLHGDSPEPDLVGSSDLTVVGATTRDGPAEDAFLIDPEEPDEPDEPGNPGVPHNLAPLAIQANSVQFGWDPGENAALYRIRRADTSVVFEQPEQDRTFTATGLLPFTTYTFTVATVTSAGIEGAQSASITLKTNPLHSTPRGSSAARSLLTPRS